MLCGRRVEYVATKTGQLVREPGFAGFTGLCSDAARALWIAPPGYKPAERVEVHDALASFRETRGRLIETAVANAVWQASHGMKKLRLGWPRKGCEP